MFLLFYISLTRVPNLQEPFMIFQRKRGFLQNLVLIKFNSIKEQKKKEGVEESCIVLQNFFFTILLSPLFVLFIPFPFRFFKYLSKKAFLKFFIYLILQIFFINFDIYYTFLLIQKILFVISSFDLFFLYFRNLDIQCHVDNSVSC